MAVTENVALEPAEGTVGSEAEQDECLIFDKPASAEGGDAPWMFGGERMIAEAFIVTSGDGSAASEPVVQTRWAVCLDTDPAEPDGWIVAEVIAMPGIATQGRTKAEALDNIREALLLALEQLAAEDVTEIAAPPHEIPAGGRVVYVTV